MKALIDADSLIYKVCFAIEENTFWNECECEAGIEDDKQVTQTTDTKVLFNTIDGMIENILFATECEDYELHLTGKNNFRESNPLGYKEHRKELRKPLGFEELRNYLVTHHKAIVNDGIEADDMVVYLKTTYPDEYVLCAIDKDVIYQTVGTHYNYNNDSIVTVTEKDTVWFLYFQTLTGDVTDGYKGCKGVGKVGAKKILDEVSYKKSMNISEYNKALYTKTLETFIDKGHNEEYLLNTMRLSSMHQFNGKKVVLLQSPLTSI